MEFALWMLILVFDVAAVVDALRGNSPVERKILWSLLIFVLPLVGMIFYFLLGREQRTVA